MSTRNVLHTKLDSFIRKYYKNQIIKGIILSFTIYISYYLVLLVLEHFNHFSTNIRTVLFYSALIIFASVFVYFIAIPTLKFLRIGNIISYKKASNIISNHFADIKDSLLNTLELEVLTQTNSTASNQLILASIDKRVLSLSPIPFTSAINFKQNYKYVKYLFLAFLLGTLIYLFYPTVFKNSTQRLVNYNTFYKADSPFKYNLLNDSLFVKKGEDFTLKLKITGEFTPSEVFIEYGGSKFLMKKTKTSSFEYDFNNINNDIDFNFAANEIYSRDYSLRTQPAPLVLDFTVTIEVPSYTQEQNQIIKNVGDITIPYGSKLIWNFKTIDTEQLQFIINDTSLIDAEKENHDFVIKKTLYKSLNYSINTRNSFFANNNVINYNINVIPDLFPTIKVQAIRDSTNLRVFYFKGFINDDYGLSNLEFIIHNKSNDDSISTIKIDIIPNVLSQEFYYAFDFTNFLSSEEIAEYYFKVWDNDAVSGNKFSKSTVYSIKLPSKEEVQNLIDEKNKELENKLNESTKLINDIKKDIEKLQEDIINDKSNSWEQTKSLQNIIKKQNKLNQIVENLAQENAENNKMKNEFLNQEKDILEKQKQIEELMESVLSDELKKLMKELQEMMKDFKPEEFNKLAEDLKMSNEEMNDQLDRNLELLKQMKVEQRIEETINKLEELAQKQEKLSEQAKDKSKIEDTKKQQVEQEKEFEEIKEKYKKAQEENKELENPMSLDELSEEEKELDEDFKKSNENLQNKNSSKASKSQKKTSQDLKKMSSMLKSMMKQNAEAQATEDMDNLRNIIDNLTIFSFSQEELISVLNGLSNRNPIYVETVNNQYQLEQRFKVINDSLYALSKRVTQISTPIRSELLSIKSDLSEITVLLEDRKNSRTKIKQQNVMTSANNLLLLLSEMLQQMQKQQAQKMKGDQQCQKPGNGKPSLSKMKSSQKSLKKQLESMMQQMKDGNKGKDGKPKSSGLSKQLAQSLAQQEKFEQALNSIMNSSSVNPETAKQLNEIKKLVEQNKNDIANRNITNQTINRQNNIITRLLQAENSDYERELDKKRKSEEEKNQKYSNPREFFEYKDIQTNFNEMLNVKSIRLNKYYQKKYKSYIINVNSKN